MTEESDISLPSQKSRHCPVCGMKVADKASECLMCSASLLEEEEAQEEPAKGAGWVPSWVSSVVVVLLALVILAGGSFGVYSLLAVEPNPEPDEALLTPTVTSTPTQTPTPTETPVPTSTPTPLPAQTHTVQEGETMSDIARTYDVAVRQILALNPDVDSELIRTGQVLLIPPARAAGELTVHVVREGETLSRIAEGYGVQLSRIRAVNSLPLHDQPIRVGQSLIIPLSTPAPSPTPGMALNPTSTPFPLYGRPPLLYPPDGKVFAGSDVPVLLQWASISVLRRNESYELSITQPAGGVISDTIRTRATASRVPLDLLQRASADVREFQWQVRVVRETDEGIYQEASAPSEVRSFVWLEPTPTPAPTVTP